MNPGEQIGPYRVVETIGRGGFATVFRCLDDRLDAEVAIKLLADNHAADPNIRARFLAEGRMLRKLDSRHLVQVHDVGETERSQPYLVLGLASRGDLRTRVRSYQEQGWVPTWDDVGLLADVLLQAATALHRNELVHRDISPANVLIRTTNDVGSASNISIVQNDERLILADLGFAKDLALSSGATVGGGTPQFSAPEQFDQRPVTSQSDLYAIARVLEWFVATADPNHDQRNYLLATLAPALSNEPAERPSSAEALRSSIHTALSTTANPSPPSPGAVAFPSSAPPHPEPTPGLDAPNPTVQQPPTPPPNQPYTSTPPSQPRQGRRTALWVGLAVGVLALVGGAAMLASQQSRTTDVVAIGENLGRSSASTPLGLVEVEGPRRIPTGETGVFVVSSPQASEYVWTLPDGTQIEGTSAIQVTGDAPGESKLAVKATTDDGSEIDVQFPFSIGPLE